MPIDSRTASTTSTTATDTATDACPYCGGASGCSKRTPARAGVQSWSCTECGLDWAITVVNPHLRTAHFEQLAATVEEIGRLRWTLREIITLATDAPQLADVELRTRLLTLAAEAAS